MANRDLTAQRARELFDYDPLTGVLTRKPCLGTRWRALPITRSHDPRGYLKTTVNRVGYFVHRLAWLISYGCWPVNEIDHINRNGGDNRLENLRDVTRKENLANRKSRTPKPRKPRPPKTKPAREAKLGWVERDHHSKTKPYRARYEEDGRRINLGFYASPEDARAALAARKQCMGKLSVDDFRGQPPG